MAFIAAKRPTITFPISFFVHGDDGQPQEISFLARYRRHKAEDLADLQDALSNRHRSIVGGEIIKRPDGTEVPDWPYASDIEFIVAVADGWSGVKDEQDADRPIADLREVLADWPEAVVPMFQGFFEAHRGARQKN